MADKLTQQITEALAKAAAHPDGLPLYASKSEPGLFPNTSAAKSAAQKCLADGLVRVTSPDTKGKTPRERYALTDPGWEFLLAEVNPKQVLEDFVRVLESRQGEVGELLDTARRMADSLQGLKDAVSRVLPGVSMSRMKPNPPTPFPDREGRAELSPRSQAPPGNASFEALPRSALRGVDVREAEPRHPGSQAEPGNQFAIGESATALLEAPPAVELESMILARLGDWSGSAGEDCPLPELYRSLSLLDAPPTIGEFHDCLRKLHADGALYLHPWTGPLYALPEPAYALLAGHNVSYYASPRTQDSGFRIQDSDRNPNPES